MNNINNFFRKKIYRFTVTKQWLQDEHTIQQKSVQLARMIKAAKYSIVFTGAGCSTSIGIPDYRSGIQTIVSTGPGIWNRATQDRPPKIRIDQIVDKAIPSLTHMAIKTLLDRQIFKYLVSQNTDGLHIKSGISFDKISELHGNRNLQKCVQCKRIYFRDFRTIKRKLNPNHNTNQRQNTNQLNHQTGRQCQNCKGKLIDSIIYFGQKLSTHQLATSYMHASSCDLLLCIGSSLTVRPSSNVPILALKNNAKLSIINIQQTPFDKVSSLKINGFCDNVMLNVMKQLNIKIDEFAIQHYLNISVKQQIGGRVISIQGIDKIGGNYTYIKSANSQNKQYTPLGHQIKIPFQENMFDIDINFYGTKPSLCLYLPNYYKIFHGEQLTLKIYKKQQDVNWTIQQL